MANNYVYSVAAIKAGILPKRWMQTVNQNYMPCLTKEKVKKVIFSCGSPFVKCMILHYNICSGIVRLTVCF